MLLFFLIASCLERGHPLPRNVLFHNVNFKSIAIKSSHLGDNVIPEPSLRKISAYEPGPCEYFILFHIMVLFDINDSRQVTQNI